MCAVAGLLEEEFARPIISIHLTLWSTYVTSGTSGKRQAAGLAPT